MPTLPSLALVAPLALALAPVAAAQCDQEKLYASDASAVDEFGLAIAASSGRVLVGAPSATGAVFGNSGAAYVFERQAGGFVETAKLFAAGGGLNEEFGAAVAIDGTRAAIGAYRIGAPFGSGGVFVFDENPAGWTETAMLTCSEPAGEIGFAVALDGDRIATSSRGQAKTWIFERAGASWVQAATIPGHFGSSLALDGDTLFIGDFEDPVSPDFSGSVAVYEKQPAGWTLVQTLHASAPTFFLMHFGRSLALDGDRLAVGAPGREATSLEEGRVFVFERILGAWTETALLEPFESSTSSAFGTSVHLVGDRLLVGAPHAAGPGGASGAGFLFEYDGAAWNQAARLDAHDGTSDLSMGAGVGIAGDALLVGATRDSDQAVFAGAVYAFELAPTVTSFCHCALAAPCGNEDEWGGCSSATGKGAVLAAFGSASVARDDLAFQTTFLPAGRSGVLFMGAGTSAALPFGNGQLCVNVAPLFRFPVRVSSATGCMQEGPGVAAHSMATFGPAGAITTGSTWSFQAWFRDPAGPCGAAFGTSNALAVTFQP